MKISAVHARRAAPLFEFEEDFVNRPRNRHRRVVVQHSTKRSDSLVDEALEVSPIARDSAPSDLRERCENDDGVAAASNVVQSESAAGSERGEHDSFDALLLDTSHQTHGAGTRASSEFDTATFERQLASATTLGPNAMRTLVSVSCIAMLGAALFLARGRTDRPRLAASATRVVAAASIAVERPVVATRAPEAATAPSAPPIETAPSAPSAPPATTADLDSSIATAQPTQALTDLLQTAIEARSRGVLIAIAAMSAWLDAGGTDSRAVAQFAFWLGRRGNLEAAEHWAERATDLNPRDQMAWYVLGATRLELPSMRRAAVVNALRRCADLPGAFTAECRGPISAGGSLR